MTMTPPPATRAPLAPTAVQEACAALLRAGEHARAAQAFEDAGCWAEAAAIWEQIFENGRAHAAYLRATDPIGAMRVALRCEDTGAPVESAIAAALALDGGATLDPWLRKQGRSRELARLCQRRGASLEAAQHFVAAEAWMEAALSFEEAGRWRDAGRYWERHLQLFPQDAPATLQLARILLRFRRFDDAIACLQRAQRAARDHSALRASTMPMLTFAFLQLGFESAASEVLVRWRALLAGDDAAAAVPDDIEAFLASERGRALAAWCAGGMSAAPPLRAEVPVRGDAALESAWESDAAPLAVDEGADAEESDWLFWGRYLLGPASGSGGSGQVYRAFDAFTDRAVALKVYGAQALKTDAWHRYVRSLRGAASLRLAGLVELIELSETQGFVVSAWIEGESVEGRLARGERAEWLLPFARGALAVLASCHRVGLVHGAIKPTNLFFDAAGVRLTDFGAHHLLGLRSTETGGLASSWPYLPPEQLRGDAPGVTADLYALAAVLYRALTGTPPYHRPEDERQRPPDPPSVRHPALGGEWDAFFARALAPAPSARFPSASAMADALPSPAAAWQKPAPPAAAPSRPEAGGPVLLARYRQGRPVFQQAGQVQVYEGQDDTLGRPVWWLEVESEAGWLALAACARMSRGVQPVYDLFPDARRAILARDAGQRRANLGELRAHPQSLIRDLAALASALESLHAAGYAWGGFSADRATGPIGPRFRLAPAALPQPLTPASQAADWGSFEAFLAHAFDYAPAVGSHPRLALIDHLVHLRMWEAEPASAWGAAQIDPAWSRFLEALSRELWVGASNRVMVRLAARLLSSRG